MTIPVDGGHILIPSCLKTTTTTPPFLESNEWDSSVSKAEMYSCKRGECLHDSPNNLVAAAQCVLLVHTWRTPGQIQVLCPKVCSTMSSDSECTCSHYSNRVMWTATRARILPFPSLHTISFFGRRAMARPANTSLIARLSHSWMAQSGYWSHPRLKPLIARP